MWKMGVKLVQKGTNHMIGSVKSHWYVRVEAVAGGTLHDQEIAQLILMHFGIQSFSNAVVGRLT
jgi:hypothetical protein